MENINLFITKDFQDENQTLNLDIISANLKRLRKDCNLSCEDVARVIGISRQAYNNYELKTKQFTLNSALVLSKFYNVSIDEIVGNPCTVGRSKALDFFTYEIKDGEITSSSNIIISTEDDTKFMVKDPINNKIYLFGTSVDNVPKSVMMFSYEGKIYKSKVLETSTGENIFFDNSDKPVVLSKKEYKSIVFIGALLFIMNQEYDFF
jgi:transcriptional regulator with XRE-family HTH domain